MTAITLVLIDGLRPDGIFQAGMPALQRLAAEGAHNFAAHSVMPSLTLPCITSLFFSLAPETHGVQSNTFNPAARSLPGLFDVFHEAGLSTAFIYNWAPLRDLAQPNAVDSALCLNNSELPSALSGAGDSELVEMAGPLLGQEFDFRFIYLGCTDMAGHLAGWMSAPYLAAAANADRCLERILERLPPGGITAVLADHGGHDHGHGSDCAEDLTIPLVFHGPGIRPGRLAAEASILDAAPTLLALAGLEAPEGWQGKNLL